MPNQQNRVFQYDFIRAIAIVFVVAVHALVVIDFQDKNSLFYFMTMQAVFFTCNGLFFMLSGKFALSSRSYEGYYRKKIIAIIIPTMIFFAIRTIYNAILLPPTESFLLEEYALNILGVIYPEQNTGFCIH